MADKYLTVREFAEIRNLSETTVKRKIADGTILDVQSEPSKLKGHIRYLIPQSALLIPRKKLISRERNHIEDLPESPYSLYPAELSHIRLLLEEANARIQVLDLSVNTYGKQD
jgi:hypothetical protein